MTQILVHNGHGDAMVFTAEGRMIGPHQTEASDTRDQVTARLLDCGRLTTVEQAAPEPQPAPETQSETEPEPEPDSTPDADGEEVLEEPAGNATTEAWADYAVSQGYDREDVDSMGRTEIQELLETTLAGGDQSATEATPPGGADPDSEEEK